MTRLAMAMSPERADDVCDPVTRALIDQHFDAVWATGPLDEAGLAELITGAEVVITSWGTPKLPVELLGEDRVRIVGHAAGTVKNLLDPQAIEGLTVFSAASRIAWSVGEYCLGACLALWRRLPEYDGAVREGGWRADTPRGRELRGASVGIVGASSTARAFVAQLMPFGVQVKVYDPYLTEVDASALGVTPAPLAEVMRSEIVSVHVPNVPATEGMITAELIDLIPDGGLMINSSRAAAVDSAYLLEQAHSGRLSAALDVFDTEPTTIDQRYLGCRNLLLTPHMAGDSVQGHRALTGFVLDDIIDFLNHGRRGTSWVDPARWSIAA